jgi:hypothetical protein
MIVVLNLKLQSFAPLPQKQDEEPLFSSEEPELKRGGVIITGACAGELTATDAAKTAFATPSEMRVTFQVRMAEDWRCHQGDWTQMRSTRMAHFQSFVLKLWLEVTPPLR